MLTLNVLLFCASSPA